MKLKRENLFSGEVYIREIPITEEEWREFLEFNKIPGGLCVADQTFFDDKRGWWEFSEVCNEQP